MSTPEARAKFVSETMTSDLAFIWSDAGVDEEMQYKIAQHFKNVRIFANFADDRPGVRDALKSDYARDQATGASERGKVAAIVSAWEASRDFSAKESELKAEQKMLGVQKQLSTGDKQVLRKSVETIWGKIPDREAPHNDYLAVKLDEIEDGEFNASPLDTIISRKDQSSEDVEAATDKSGRLRIVRKKCKSSMPVDSEEYRTKMRIEGNAWLMVQAKLRNKPFLAGLTQKTFGDFADYVLGDKVATLKVPDPKTGAMLPLSPPWNIVLHYETKLREAAMDLVSEDSLTLAAAMAKVVKDSELKELYFTGILSVTSSWLASRESATPAPPLSKYRRLDENLQGGEPGSARGGPGKGNNNGENGSNGRGSGSRGRGKGNGGNNAGGRGKRGRGKGNKNKVQLLWQTEDGRHICFDFNHKGMCLGNCGRVHICRYPGCGKAHSLKGNHPGFN